MADSPGPLAVYTLPRLRARPHLPALFIPDRMFLAEALDLLGGYEYPADWSGEELLARPKIVQPAGPQMRTMLPTTASVVAPISPRLSPSRPPRGLFLRPGRLPALLSQLAGPQIAQRFVLLKQIEQDPERFAARRF
jgi:hypothetical protein